MLYCIYFFILLNLNRYFHMRENYTQEVILLLIEGRAMKTIALIKATPYVNFVKPVG